MRSLLTCCLFLVSCGTNVCEGSDFTTKQNLCVFKNGFDVSKQEIEEITMLTQQEVTFVHPNTYPKEKIENFEDTSLKFVEELKDKLADGQTHYEIGILADNNFRIKAEYKDGNCSLRWFIFVHEILHVYLAEVEGIVVHPRGWFVMEEFSAGENNNSIQNVIYQKIKCINENN